jgi:hypothetical protein
VGAQPARRQSAMRLSANTKTFSDFHGKFENGAGYKNRTRDLRFTKPLLYQLS